MINVTCYFDYCTYFHPKALKNSVPSFKTGLVDDAAYLKYVNGCYGLFCEMYEWKKNREKARFLPLCFLFLSGWRSKDAKDGEGWGIASNGSVFKKRAQNNIDGPLDAPASHAISWSELLSQPRKRKQKAIEDCSKPKHQLNLTSVAKMKTSRTTKV